MTSQYAIISQNQHAIERSITNIDKKITFQLHCLEQKLFLMKNLRIYLYSYFLIIQNAGGCGRCAMIYGKFFNGFSKIFLVKNVAMWGIPHNTVTISEYQML